jgi:ABC-type proline/glycine betaine transport system ATPase subunit
MNMKKIFLALSVVALFSLSSCDKKDSPGDNWDLSNSLPPYVALSSTAAKTIHQGTSTTVTFQMRTAMQQTVTVTYDVTGAVNLANQTVVFDREKISVNATVNIPNNVIVPPATTATATLTLTKAVTADGKMLTIGSKNTPATQKVTLNIIP